ncbi:MAG TPA: 2-keto-4-pentenoate hydratase [Dehalococcoidia bacterium]|nr:2-keto-4-pentenoate hydratase [Chloroflexota bacterium]HCE76380.1 2-keto-4-pentenoate hydratase [Dehalococcoidia bacterium]|tara:strand:- start:834 stop:1616 length:783 start_codon:yes stop_codon:yes gene_type:complete
MKWVRYQLKDETSYGLLDNNIVTKIDGSPFSEYQTTDQNITLDRVKILPPVIPKTFYAAGINYKKHVSEAAALLNRAPNLPEKADIGYRANNAIIGHEDPIVIPRDATNKIHYEAELVVVIGKTAKNVRMQNALHYVLGYTIGNDVSERTWQASDRTLWRAKNTDTFKPMGPWIETEANLDEMITTVRLNGRETISFQTNDMIFGVEKYISEISKYITLQPRDVIWMGTDGTSEDMKDGDTCEIEISGVGRLSNPVTRAT